MTACGGGGTSPPASTDRAAAARAEAKAMLLDPGKAFFGHVILEDTLVESALDEVMRNVESWLNGDWDRLRFQLGVQTDMVRREMLVSDAGLLALQRQVSARFRAPMIRRREVSSAGVVAGSLDRKLAEIAGIVLSGRPAVARDIPSGSYIEVEGDYGLLPAPLEKNSRAKGYITPVCYRESGRHSNGDSDAWLEQGHRPSLTVVARSARELMQKHPEAARLVLRYVVLRRMGQPVEWRFLVEADGDGFAVEGTGRSPGLDEKTERIGITAARLADLAAKAPVAAVN